MNAHSKTGSILKITNYALRLSLLFLPVLVLIWAVLTYGVNLVFWDDFEPITDFINMKASGKIDWHALAALHNEHRFFVPRVIMITIGALTHWNTKVMMMFSVLLLSLSYFIIVFQTVKKRFVAFDFIDCGYALIIGLVLFNTVQYENLLWGFQLAWFLIEFCAIAGLYCMSKYCNTHNIKYVYPAVLFAVISSFSSLPGLAIWPCYIVVLLMHQLTHRDMDKKIFLYIFAAMLCTFIVYFNGYHEITRHANAKPSSPMQALLFAFSNLGSVLAGNEASILTLTAGIGEAILSMILICILIATKKVKQNIFPIGLMILSGGIALMLGLGRSGWINMASRYTTFALLMVIGNLSILRQYITSENMKGWAAAICFLLLVQMNLYTDKVFFSSLEFLRAYKQTAKEVLLDYKNQPFAKFYYVYPFKTRTEALQRIEKIENAELSVFYDKERIK